METTLQEAKAAAGIYLGAMGKAIEETMVQTPRAERSIEWLDGIRDSVADALRKLTGVSERAATGAAKVMVSAAIERLTGESVISTEEVEYWRGVFARDGRTA